jgi:multidrug efflux pump subunit AcrA (membrane-fusion protein)
LPIDENKIKQITSRSEFYQDILDKIPSRIISWGNTGILIILILIGLGLKYIKYPDEITSEALITTEKPPVEIYTRTSGRIIQLLKKDQEHVKSGDWIFILNNSANYRDVLKTKKIIDKLDSSDFWKSINDTYFEESINLGDLQNSYYQFYRSVGEFKLFVELNVQYKQVSINSRRKEDLISLKQKINNQLITQEKQYAIVKLDYERALKLYDEGYISKTDLEQKEIVYLNMKNRMEELSSSVINTQLQTEMIEKENTSLETDKNDTYFRLRSNVLQYYNSLLFQLSEWQNKYVLSSPIDGVLNFYDVRNKDQFLATEKKVFTVTPIKTQNYFALVKLPIANSGKVHKGQNCIIRLHNYSYTEFGMLRGIIQEISSVPKDNFYSVKISLPNQLITTLHKQLDSKGELTGEAEIIIEDLTLFDRIFGTFINLNY